MHPVKRDLNIRFLSSQPLIFIGLLSLKTPMVASNPPTVVLTLLSVFLGQTFVRRAPLCVNVESLRFYARIWKIGLTAILIVTGGLATQGLRMKERVAITGRFWIWKVRVEVLALEINSWLYIHDIHREGTKCYCQKHCGHIQYVLCCDRQHS